MNEKKVLYGSRTFFLGQHIGIYFQNIFQTDKAMRMRIFHRNTSVNLKIMLIQAKMPKYLTRQNFVYKIIY